MKSFLLLAITITFALVLAACGNASEPQEQTFDLEISGRALTGDDTIVVAQDDTVVLNVTTDEAGVFHIHGYDQEIEISPEEPGMMSFVANATGRFELSMHAAHADDGHSHDDDDHSHEGEDEAAVLGHLEVQPR